VTGSSVLVQLDPLEVSELLMKDIKIFGVAAIEVNQGPKQRLILLLGEGWKEFVLENAFIILIDYYIEGISRLGLD
jgi:hypothetical protein